MKEKLPDIEEDESADIPQAEISIILLRLYNEKSNELAALRADAERRDRRHARINGVQTIIIAFLVFFLLFWLVYDVIYLDRGWIRAVLCPARSAFDIIREWI